MHFDKFVLGAAAGLLIAVASSSAQAACSQQFTHTTCSGWGPMQKCTNHFKTVCTAAPAKPVATIAPPKAVIAPPTAGIVNGGRLVTDNGAGLKPAAGLVSNSGSTLISNKAGLVGNAGGALVGNAGGALVGNAGGALKSK